MSHPAHLRQEPLRSRRCARTVLLHYRREFVTQLRILSPCELIDRDERQSVFGPCLHRRRSVNGRIARDSGRTALRCETVHTLARRSSISLARSIPDTVPSACGLHAKDAIENALGADGLAYRRIAVSCQRPPFGVASARSRWQPRDLQFARCAGDRICTVQAAHQAHLHQAVPCPGRRGKRGKAK